MSSPAKKQRTESYAFTLESIPPHHFLLGDDLFVTVSNFSGTVRVHLRHFNIGDFGECTPTKRGVALPPYLWQCLAEAMDDPTCVSLPSRVDEIYLVKNALLLTTVHSEKERAVVITMQRLYKRKDFSMEFLPGVSVLNERQWKELKGLRRQLTETVLGLTFGPLMRYFVANETAKQQPFPDSQLSRETGEEMLTTSLAELLADKLASNISELFECTGCTENYANQLGHECMTYTRETKLDMYFDRAMCKINMMTFAREFVSLNSYLGRFITPRFLRPIEPKNLMNCAREMILASDPLTSVVRNTIL